MELMYPVVIAAVAALLFALVMAVRVLRCDRGEEDIRRISGIIGRAASAFLRRQYAVIAIFFVIVSAALLVMNLCFGKGNIYTPFAFISGGFFLCSVRLYRHEDRHSLERQNGSCSTPQSQRRTAHRILERYGYGHVGGRSRSYRHQRLVSPA